MRPITLLLVLVAALAACGGSGAAASAGGAQGGAPGDFCKLVTQAEIEAATGVKVSPIDSDDEGGDCTWALESLAAVNLRIDDENSTDFAAQKLLFPDGRDISGIADKAFWAPSNEGQLLGSVLYFAVKGWAHAVQLVLFPMDDAKNQKTAETIARAALSRY